MKRAKLIAYLRGNGCRFLREGGRHSVFLNPINDTISTVPRHAEIRDNLAQKICKDLGIPKIMQGK